MGHIAQLYSQSYRADKGSQDVLLRTERRPLHRTETVSTFSADYSVIWWCKLALDKCSPCLYIRLNKERLKKKFTAHKQNQLCPASQKVNPKQHEFRELVSVLSPSWDVLRNTNMPFQFPFSNKFKKAHPPGKLYTWKQLVLRQKEKSQNTQPGCSASTPHPLLWQGPHPTLRTLKNSLTHHRRNDTALTHLGKWLNSMHTCTDISLCNLLLHTFTAYHGNYTVGF